MWKSLCGLANEAFDTRADFVEQKQRILAQNESVPGSKARPSLSQGWIMKPISPGTHTWTLAHCLKEARFILIPGW
jgi:hypothetical protein